MIKNSFIIVFLFCFATAFSQVENDTIDTKYLEDQIYFSGFYNILNNKEITPDNTLFSGGLTVGFIRDIPFNKRRNIGIGIGLGYAFNTYNREIVFVEDPNNPEEFSASKFRTHLVEFPFELRWRTSTPTKYSFWRIYTGFKVAYVFSSIVKVDVDNDVVKFKNISAFENFQYGLTLSVGHGIWNAFAYYGLSSIFNSVYIIGEELNLSDFNVGIKLYIL